MKKLIKISILILISAIFIYFLSKRNIIDIPLLANAFREYKLYIAGIMFAIILNHLAMAYRYKSILKLLGLSKKTENVISSTFISNSIGQWLPGSLAFIEVLRISLMIKRRKGPPLSPIDKFNLTIASLFDRIIGLFVALIIGTVLTFYFLIKMPDKSSSNFYIVLGLFIFNLATAFFIAALPVIAGSNLLKHLLARCERICLRVVSHSIAQHAIMSIFHKLNNVIKVFSENGKQYHFFWIPIGYTVISIGSFTLGMHFSWLALASFIPFFETLALNSTLTLSVVIPISFGGIGAPQFVAAILYGALGANATKAASAQLLMLGVSLITVSCLGLIYFPRIIKDIIKPRIA